MRYSYKRVIKTDSRTNFRVFFNPNTGLKLRTGILDENGADTGDPFQADYPEMIDIGIMEKCVCAPMCNVGCYQNAISRTGKNMSLSDFAWLIRQSRGKTLQVALGGAGDPDTHEHFADILRICYAHNIVPNFTTSGIRLTPEKAELCKMYCGAVAVSEHGSNYTTGAIKMLLDAGVRTNVHYVLNRHTIGRATEILRTGNYRKGINALVFLLYKPIGLGRSELVLTPEDESVKYFFDAFDHRRVPFKVGFDSCTSAGLANFSKNFRPEYTDYCEGARFSMYVSADLRAMPCSFLNQDTTQFYQLDPDPEKGAGIQQAWDSELFARFRHILAAQCPDCEKRSLCGGGCPVVSEITLCGNKQADMTERREM